MRRSGVSYTTTHQRESSRDQYDPSDSNVFKRLTSETMLSGGGGGGANNVGSQQSSSASSNTGAAQTPELGLIKPYAGGATSRFRSAPVMLAHVAEGHAKAVLALDAHDSLLFTGSKDRTAKIWDLNTGRELASLAAGHVSHVTRVRFSPATRLCFTVSSYYVNVWDLRVPTAHRCLKTLWY